MVPARGLSIRINHELKKEIEKGRLLIITPFENKIKRASKLTSEKRNRFMLELADFVTIGYADKSGMIEKLIKEFTNNKKSFLKLKIL